MLQETIKKNTLILKRIHDFINKTQLNSHCITLKPDLSENYSLADQTKDTLNKFQKINSKLINHTLNYANSSKKVKKINCNLKLYDEIDNYMKESLFSKSKIVLIIRKFKGNQILLLA